MYVQNHIRIEIVWYCTKTVWCIASKYWNFQVQTSYRCHSSTYVSTKHSVSTVIVLVECRNSLCAQRHSWLPA